MNTPREPGSMDWARLDDVHAHLMAESGMYRYAYEHKLAGLVNHLQLRELDHWHEIAPLFSMGGGI